MNYYLIFHHNLAFSSIPEGHYRYLIDNVYAKLLDIVEAGYPLGLEFTGETLELLHRLRPQYLERLQSLCRRGLCEVLCSSYSQAIFPLIPVPVNRWNMAFGHDVCKMFFGRISRLAYLNEQVYSESMPVLYKEIGIRALVFDWMSAGKGNSWPPAYRYQVVRHAPSGMLFLWSDSIAFQKFQRAVWDKIDGDDWLKFVASHQELSGELSAGPGGFCLYASDAEVFDYQPGCLTPCSSRQGHLIRMRQLLAALVETGGRIVPPSAVLDRQQYKIPTVDRVATASYPVRTKKQDKYNVTRWAVTGRETAKMNTLCHQLLAFIQHIEAEKGDADGVIQLKKELVSLWGSDFRTQTTDEKYEAFRNRMGAALSSARLLIGSNKKQNSRLGGTNSRVNSENEHWQTLKDGRGGESGTVKVQGRRVRVSGKDIVLTLLRDKGLAVESSGFSAVDFTEIVGTIPHGHFADISLGSDFYSGHLVLITQEGRQHTDLSCPVDTLEFCETDRGLGLRNKRPMELPGLSILKTFRLEGRRLSLTYDLYASDLRPASLRLGIWTLRPWFFDRTSLYYQCHQGGASPERHPLDSRGVQQDMPVNPVVTARHCLGNTSGVLRLGDAKKYIEISTLAAELYSVPLLHHELCRAWDQSESFFTRVYYSICERDDVANVFWKGHLRISFVITAGKTATR